MLFDTRGQVRLLSRHTVLQRGDLLQLFFGQLKQFSVAAWYRLRPDYSESYLCTIRKFPGPFSHLLVVWPGSFLYVSVDWHPNERHLKGFAHRRLKVSPVQLIQNGIENQRVKTAGIIHVVQLDAHLDVASLLRRCRL